MPDELEPKPKIFNQLRAVVERRKTEAQLSELARKRVTAGFIRALVVFEEQFGHLWGHGKPSGECTPEELALRERWRVARAEILENGNGQVRLLGTELAVLLVIRRDGVPAVSITPPQNHLQDSKKDPR